MKIFIACLTLSVALLGLSSAWSQTAPTTQSETSTASEADAQKDQDAQQATKIKKNNQQTKVKPNKRPEVFNPSEEISEDFAVSFPVDI